MIEGFLEKRVQGFNSGNFLVLKLQITIILMLASVFSNFFLSFNYFLGIIALLSIYFLFVLLYEVRKKFRRDFKYFLIIFGGFFIFAQGGWIIQLFLLGAEKLNFSFLLLFFLIVFFVVVKLFLGKGFTKGKVLSSNGKITVVETVFDIKSFSNGGKHVFETKKKYREGEEVEIQFKKGFFGSVKKKLKE